MEINLSFYICDIQTCIYYIPVTRSHVYLVEKYHPIALYYILCLLMILIKTTEEYEVLMRHRYLFDDSLNKAHFSPTPS